jgi:GWxTD domain-containing protein
VYAQLDFLPLKVDYASFISGNKDKTYTEIYVSIYQSDLTYQIEDTLQVAHFSHTLEISNDDSIIQNVKRQYKNTESKGVKIQYFKQFVDVFAFEFESGIYELIVTVYDEVAERKGEYTLKLTIPEYQSDLTISDIQLATGISKTTQKSNFSNKNNLEIIPNPSRTYGIVQPMLYFYFEVYNLVLNEDGYNRYAYHYYISDSEGQTVRDFPEKVKSTSAKIIAESGGTNIITLSSNAYFLNIEIEDMNSREKIYTRKEFQVDKPSRESGIAKTTVPVSGYELYMNYTKDELIDEFEKSTYVAVQQEIDIFYELDEEGMKKFLAEFWKRRDPDPTTEINEFKRYYFNNLEYAQNNFSNSFKEGWKTDRGRILLVYGKPDEIERYPSTIDTLPYEIWQYYNLEGGSIFVFADVRGFGTFQLIHSSYRNEIKDPNWRDRVGGQDSFGDPGFQH